MADFPAWMSAGAPVAAGENMGGSGEAERVAQVDTRLSTAQIMGLGAMALAVLVIANDFTALSVALPAIEQDFGADVTTVQWIITGYALVFGVLIVTGGRLADMFGRRHIFFVGTTIFALFSALGGFATDAWMLLAARGAMGVGGALMWPAILGMTYALTPPGRAALAGALVLGSAGFGNAVGPLLGGGLTDALSWRWIFFLNLPIAAIAVLVVWRVVPRIAVDAKDQRIDYAGVLTLSIGLLALLMALDLGVDLGWTSAPILALFAVAVASLLLFARVERGAGRNALVPGDVMGNRTFLAASMATLLMSAIFFAALLFLPQLMAKQFGFSAVGAGAGLLPMMGVFALTSFVSGPLYARLGAKLIVTLGAACLALGMFLLSRVEPTTTYAELVPGMVVLGIGVGLFYSSITTVAITALDPSRSSLAGAIIYMFQIAGGAVGLGLNTALVVTAPSLVEGIRIAFLVDAGLALAGVVVAVLFVGGRIDRETLEALLHRHRAHG
jgi:EmrB/QacA subfamily drug resistance transporter